MKAIKLSPVFCLILILLMNACRVGKDYVRPETDLPDLYRYGGNFIDSTEVSLSDVSWQDFFADTTLLHLIDLALINNYDMRKAVKNIEIANQYVFQSKAAYLPQLDAELAGINQQWRSDNFYSGPSSKWYGEDGPGDTAPNSLFQYQSQYYSMLSSSWEIDIWGKLRRQKEVAVAEYLQTDEARKAIQTSLVSSVAEGYYNLMMLDAQLEVARRNATLSDSTLRMVKLQYEAGEITALAVQQTESQKLIALSLVPSLEQDIAIQENMIMALTGQMPDRIERSGRLNDIKLRDSLEVGVPLQLVSNRPDVRMSELALQAANAEVGVAQAFRYPSLTLSANIGINAMLPQNWLNIPGSLIGGFIGGITQPVFSGRRLKTRHEVAKLERDKAELEFHQVILDAATEVSNALVKVEKLKERSGIAEQRVSTSELAVKNANLLFRSGYASYLEVITAQSNALNSELDLVRIKQQQLNAKVELYRALGGGWK